MQFKEFDWLSGHGIERFSIECPKAKTKVITPTNRKKRKQHKGPIRIPSKYT